MKKYFTILASLLMLWTLSACKDDLAGNNSSDGLLHLKFTFNDPNGQWNDDGTPRRQTRLHQPIELQNPEGIEQPFYLHCEELNDIISPEEVAPVTRGERIDGEAFDARNKIKCFGLYAKVGGNKVLPITTEIQRSTLTEEGDWWVEEDELLPDESEWDTDDTGDFYGFAPFPGWDADEDAGNGHARCITVDDATATPTITFTMQPDEKLNKDVLTARKLGVSSSEKNTGVELQFRHVLTALKFKVKSSDFLTYTVGIGSGATNYYVHIKKLTLWGIYKEGTAEIGNEYSQEDKDPDTRTSNWTMGSAKGSCTVDISKTRTQISSDQLINTDENCLMVLPQTVPEGAKLIITADLTRDAAGTDAFMENASFEVNLEGLTWKPGFTYTYKLSKDPSTYSYTLNSEYDGTTGKAFSFTHEGGSQDFNVTSYVQKLEEGSTTTNPVKWHVEYSEDGGTNWTAGLPVGFTLKNKSTDEVVGANSEIPGSTTAVAYTLTAPVRVDESPTITTLTSHDYSQYAGDDGYYDLSLHGIGFSPEICSQTTARNTANCYIVNGYGKFKLPLVYGNAIKQGTNNPIAYKYTWTDTHGEDQGHGVFCDHTGNQINQPWIFNGGQFSRAPSGVEIVWQDEENVVRSNSVKLSDDNDYLCFEILKGDVRPANIVLAVKDGSDIAWSWHIWVTAYDDFHETTELSKTISGTTYKMKVAKRNLGWRAPEIKHYKAARNFIFRVVQNDLMGKNVRHTVTQNSGLVALGGSNITYQNGRKDPFPNTSVYVSSYTTDASGNVSTVTYAQKNLFSSIGITITTTRYGVAESIKHPKTYYNTARNWFEQTYSDSPNDIKTIKEQQRYQCWDPSGSLNKVTGADWNMEVAANYHKNSKTIYDPSPVGFRVPSSGFCGMLENLSYTYHDTYPEKVDGKNISAPIPYITDNTYGLTFYLAGCRRQRYKDRDKDEFGNTIKVNDFGLADFRTYGYIWTAGIYTNGTNGTYILTKNAQAVKVGNNARDVCQGFAVRPIVDDIEEVEAYDGADVMNFRQGDALNVVLSKKTASSDLVWGISNLSSQSFTINGSTLTLQNIVKNKEDVRVFIKNIRVYFEYNGYTYGIAIKRINNNFRITYGTETHGGDAYDLVSTIPDHYQYSAVWARKDFTNIKDATEWAGLVELSTLRANITRVEADLRVTYYE